MRRHIFLLFLLSISVGGCDLFGSSLDTGRFEGEGTLSVFSGGALRDSTLRLAGTAQFRVKTDGEGMVVGTDLRMSDENGSGTVFFGLGPLRSDGSQPFYDGVGTYAIDPGAFGGSHFPGRGGLDIVGLEGTLRITDFGDEAVEGSFEGTGDSAGWHLEFRARVTPQN